MHPYNEEFNRLLKKAGWNKADAARELEMSPPVVVRYINGETRPSLSTLKLLKVMLGDKTPMPEDDRDRIVHEIKTGLLEYESELIKWLRELPYAKASAVTAQLIKIAELGKPKAE